MMVVVVGRMGGEEEERGKERERKRNGLPGGTSCDKIKEGRKEGRKE
jgi:hypothetical protein